MMAGHPPYPHVLLRGGMQRHDRFLSIFFAERTTTSVYVRTGETGNRNVVLRAGKRLSLADAWLLNRRPLGNGEGGLHGPTMGMHGPLRRVRSIPRFDQFVQRDFLPGGILQVGVDFFQ